MTIVGCRGGEEREQEKESSLQSWVEWINLEVTVISGTAAFNHENLKIIYLGKGKRSGFKCRFGFKFGLYHIIYKI